MARRQNPHKLCHLLIGDDNIAAFREKYRIPCDVYFRVPTLQEEADYTLPTEIPIPIGAIIEGGLRFPLPRLFRQILHHYNVHPNDLAMNSYRILFGIIALNEKHNLHLGLEDIEYCYTFVPGRNLNNHYFTAPTPKKLICHLPDTNKQFKREFVYISGNWEFGDDEHIFGVPRTLAHPSKYRQSLLVRICMILHLITEPIFLQKRRTSHWWRGIRLFT